MAQLIETYICNCEYDTRRIIIPKNGFAKLTCGCGNRFIRYIGLPEPDGPYWWRDW